MVNYFNLDYISILLWFKLELHTVKEFKTNLDFLDFRLNFFYTIDSWSQSCKMI